MANQYKITDSFDGKDLTPKNFYRKSSSGRKVTAQKIANEYKISVLLLNTDTGGYISFKHE